MLTQGPRNPITNPNSIAEDEEFEITYSGDSPSTQKKVKYKKIHTLGVSSLCGLATIAEYIIRRQFEERMAIYKNILKYAYRKNLGDSLDPADPADPAGSPDFPNIELKLDTIDPRYFQLIEKFQEARNKRLKKFFREKIYSIRGDQSSSDSVLSEELTLISIYQMAEIGQSLGQLDVEDAELYQSTYHQVFSNTDGLVDVIAFDEFKNLFQVKSISEIFDFANQRAQSLQGDEGLASQTVTFFTAYFENDNSCQLWIINLLQNYADQVNNVMQSTIPETEDYPIDFLEVFFRLAINKVFPDEVDAFVTYDRDTFARRCYNRRFINIQKRDTVFSPIFTTGSQQAINSTDCIFAGGSQYAGAGHYSYCQREGEKKFPQPTEDLARIVGPEELGERASDAAGHGARVSTSAAAVARSASGDSAAASGDAQAGRQRRGRSGGGEESLRRRLYESFGPADNDPTYDYNLQFQQVATTGYNLYCGYGSIANYVKFLPVDERMAFYKKLFSPQPDNHEDNKLDIFDGEGDFLPNIKDELLIVERFLTLRQEKVGLFKRDADRSQKDRKLFVEASGVFSPEYYIYNDFIKKYKIVNHDHPEFNRQGPYYYQTWMAQFLKNKLEIINSKLIERFNEIMPSAGASENIQDLSQLSNLYEDQRKKLFQFYFENKASARISNEVLTNPEIENKELAGFHRALIEKRDEVDDVGDQKLFYQLYDYFLKKFIPEGSHDNIVIHDQPVPYKHFYKKQSYETFLQTAVNIDTIASELERGEERLDLSPEIASAIISDKANVQYFLIKIVEHFCREFSFEKQFVNLLHSDTFLTHASGSHYTTMIPAYKAENPFPDNEPNLGVEAQLQLSNQQIEMQKKNVEEAFKSAQMALGNIDLQVSRGGRPSPTLINSYHSISFTRLHGRQNNNYSYVEENRDGQSKSTFSKINSIIEDKKKGIGLGDKELAMAIFLSKKFGGIGTKSQKILEYYQKNNTAVKDYLENNNSKIFKKIINFSYQFQQECQSQGIYSGNERLADDRKKKFGLRLSFIPDEIFRFHLNKLKKDSNTKKFIIGEIKKSQEPQAMIRQY